MLSVIPPPPLQPKSRCELLRSPQDKQRCKWARFKAAQGVPIFTQTKLLAEKLSIHFMY